MRCKACDVILDDVETAKKGANGVHYDLCTECLTVSIATHWELVKMEWLIFAGNISQDDVLQLQENYDNILSSIKDY